MKQQILLALPLFGAVLARPAHYAKKRSVPREHAHEDILRKVNTLLQLNNPDNIQDAVFGLLGAAAAANGAGDIADPDCLHQATADQAFSNAKEAGDIDGMTDALIFRAIERNTGSVGLESVLCESIQAVNVEIAAIQQHQDAAADGAQELNKEITAELARQIASIGGDPLRAIEAGTFAPGDLDDATANGGGCNDENDADGCINSLGLLVPDLSEEEILAAVEDVAVGGNDAEADDAEADDAEADEEDEAANVGNACELAAAKQKNKAAKQHEKVAAVEEEDAAADEEEQAVNEHDNVADEEEQAVDDEEDAAVDEEEDVANDANDANEDVANEEEQQDVVDDGEDAAQDGSLAGCNAAIQFGQTSDGRQEDAFEPVDLETFNQGSALNIDIITNFICTQIENRCGVGEDVVAQCEEAAAATEGLEGQDAADAFNNALGV